MTTSDNGARDKPQTALRASRDRLALACCVEDLSGVVRQLADVVEAIAVKVAEVEAKWESVQPPESTEAKS